MPNEAPGSRALLPLVVAQLLLASVALGLLAARFFTQDEQRRPLFLRFELGVLAVMMAAFAGYRFFMRAPQSRRPGWQRAYAVLLLGWAAWMVVLAFRDG